MSKPKTVFQLPSGPPAPAPAGSGPPPAAETAILPSKKALAAEIMRLRSTRASGCWFWRGNFAGIHRRRPVIQFNGVQYDVVACCLYIAGKLESPFSGGRHLVTCENKSACFNPEHRARVD